jgi:hypothetical protein
MKVYRVEHADTGIGPYNQSWNYEDGFDFTSPEWRMACEHGGDSWYHPASHTDIPELQFDDDFRACFVSMRDLFAWFGGWLPIMLDCNFRIVVRDVPAETVLTGTYQAAYVIGKEETL